MGKEHESAVSLTDLKKRMRDYDQSYLELSLEYANAGLYDEAIDVLSNPGLAFNNPSVNPPLVSYYLANFWAKKGNDAKAKEYYAAACQNFS